MCPITSQGQKYLHERANQSLMRNAAVMAGLRGASLASQQAGMAPMAQSMAVHQQARQVNFGVSGLGQAGLNSLTGGFY